MKLVPATTKGENMANDFLDLDAPVSGSIETSLVRSNANVVQETFDRHMKLVYVVDVSASMMDAMLQVQDIGSFDWTPTVMERISQRIQLAVKNLTAAEADEDADEDEDELELDEVDTGDGGDAVASELDRQWFALRTMLENKDFDALKGEVIVQDLYESIGLHPARTQSTKTTKIEAVKRSLDRMIRERMDQYPDADVVLITFEGHAELYAEGAQICLNKLPLLEANGGMTKISAGIERAMSYCRRHPSPVKNHHIILVTDGLDDYGSGVELDALKALGVTFDFLHISGSSSDSYYENVKKDLTNLAVGTGGKYVRVDNLEKFSRKFFEAARRLCLAPGSTK